MAIPASVMLDTIGADVYNIPLSTPYVAGYANGTGDVPWSATDWVGFPHARHVRIDNGSGAPISQLAYDAIDIESGAVTPQEAATRVNERVNLGVQWTTLYGSSDVLLAATNAIKALGDRIWIGHVNVWLADWNLDEVEAAALLGTQVHGATCVAVQWASPTSNPNMTVPGSTMNLRDANIDVSAVDANWIPGITHTGGPVPPPTPVTFHGLLVTTDASKGFVARQVASTDDTHWQ